jgi:hypothetical protein
VGFGLLLRNKETVMHTPECGVEEGTAQSHYTPELNYWQTKTPHERGVKGHGERSNVVLA